MGTLLPRFPEMDARASLDHVQSPWTGIAGALVVMGAHVALARGIVTQASDSGAVWEWIWNGRPLWILVTALLVMIAIEVFVFGVHHRNFDWGSARPLDGEARRRIAVRWLGFTALLFLAWCAYLFLDVYRADRYFDLRYLRPGSVGEWPEFSTYFSFLAFLTPVILVAAPVYFALVERHGRDRDEHADEMLLAGWAFGRGIRGLLPGGKPAREAFLELARNPHLQNAMRSWAVKVFFLPLMMTWYCNNSSLWGGQLNQWLLSLTAPGAVLTSPDSVLRCYHMAFTGIFLLDLGLCVIGYSFTLRLFDTHIRSAEPTALGWMVALACYPPFSIATDRYLAYGGEGVWIQQFEQNSVLFITWAILILGLLQIYVLATVMFGMRFSNLTHRGILCRGPYAIVRHPAYASKNLAWWLMAVPFLRDPGDCVRLALWNMIYWLRARTEEEHLGRDPLYMEYCARVRWKFIPGVW